MKMKIVESFSRLMSHTLRYVCVQWNEEESRKRSHKTGLALYECTEMMRNMRLINGVYGCHVN